MALRRGSIKQKLTLIIMLISCASVLLTAAAISFIGYYNLRQQLSDELSFTAANTGARNSVYLDLGIFDSAQGQYATQNLQLLSVRPSIQKACLYSASGAYFAGYFNDNIPEGSCPPVEKEGGVIFSNQETLIVTQAVNNRSGSLVGYIFIESDLRDITAYINKQAMIAMGVVFAALLFSYVLAIRLQNAISRPILHLADTARHVSANKDYSIRAERELVGSENANSELLILTDAFNSMLTEIQGRDQELRTKNVELEKARDEAESASRAKSQFLANISHELRTPLNAIIGFSSIFMNQLFGPLGNSKYHEYAHDINESGVHLLDIINDILDLSKAEAGKLSLDLEEVHVPKVIKKCITILSERATEGNITVLTHIPDTMPYLTADRLRFIQIILNILSNAVKFTPSGGKVTISAQQTEEYFVINIEDTGIGMARIDIDKAFQSFGQIDSGLNRKYEGTGLGLPLTKRLVELHNGVIQVDSVPEQGTNVTLKFLCSPEAVAALKAQHKAA